LSPATIRSTGWVTGNPVTSAAGLAKVWGRALVMWVAFLAPTMAIRGRWPASSGEVARSQMVVRMKPA
jgi:hypothetical protein